MASRPIPFTWTSPSHLADGRPFPSRLHVMLSPMCLVSGKFCNASGPLAVPTESVGWLDTTPPAKADNRSLVLFDNGDEVQIQAGEDGIRFLLVSGKPLGEPVAWYGPIV